MSIKRTARTLLLVACVAAVPGPASALNFKLGDADVRMINLFTVGATMRMQDRSDALVGKTNLAPGLCIQRTSPDGYGNLSFRGDTCETGNGGASNLRYVDAPGAFSVNGDSGNLNFDRHDIVNATAKLTTDLSVSFGDTLVFARAMYFFDHQYENLTNHHPDTTLQASSSPFSREGRKVIGSDLYLLDYFISHNFRLGERILSVKLGSHVLNWGESAFLALNSLTAINAANAVLLRLPGSDIKEVFDPTGMLSFNFEVTRGLNLEGFWQYEWKPVTIDPVGSYFSSTDFVGAGGSYAMLTFGKAPEDPLGLYRPVDNADDPTAVLGSTSSRTLRRLPDREPSDHGQFGFALRSFWENLNGGTEIAVYFANYHARIPSVSVLAADASCVPSGSAGVLIDVAALLTACGIPATNLLPAAIGVGPYLPATREALPLDTPKVFVEYPEDIRMYGVSFNTTVGDWALSGEYAFRDNLPTQIHPIDLLLAALQPAFPEQDLNLAVATLPGRRTAVPDFVQTNYRNEAVTPNMYIRGYERMKVGQAGFTLLRLFGGSNLLRASQVTTIFEVGMTHVMDFPDLSELQFMVMGAVADQHISSGANGTPGVNPRDVRTNPNDPASNRSDPEMRQNPAPQNRASFGTEYSWGYRAVALARYDNLLFGANIELLAALFHDVQGSSPGIGMNFIEGRMQILSGVRFDYQSTWLGELRYTAFTGAGGRDALADRDHLTLWLGYQF
jgi:hypothetical protein